MQTRARDVSGRGEGVDAQRHANNPPASKQNPGREDRGYACRKMKEEAEGTTAKTSG